MGKLLLWDVDGTLIINRGQGDEIYSRAAESALELDLAVSQTPIHGRTDHVNITNILNDGGISGSDFHRSHRAMVEEMPRQFSRMVESGVWTLTAAQGVAELLQACQRGGATNSLLTGNLAETSRRKLHLAGLDDYVNFDLGAYSEDAPARVDLLAVAFKRVAEATGTAPSPADIWVIGDTPFDYEVARVGGVKSMLVASGAYSFDELAGLGAELVVHDLTDTETLSRRLLA